MLVGACHAAMQASPQPISTAYQSGRFKVRRWRQWPRAQLHSTSNCPFITLRNLACLPLYCEERATWKVDVLQVGTHTKNADKR